jgi:predicted RNase H-like nuclease (RuvC/YqgF family)
MLKLPIRYLPKNLTKKDKTKYKNELIKSRRLYKLGKYHKRTKVKSFKTKKSTHIKNAEKMYKIKNMTINNGLVKKTGCSKQTLKKIVNKGMGAYYSSGSRPNQSAESWGLARLASAITGAKASVVDNSILRSGCKKTSKALQLSNKAVSKKYGKTLRRTPKIKV